MLRVVNFPFTLFFRPAEDPSWDEMLPKFEAEPAQDAGVIEQTLENFGLTEGKMVQGGWGFIQAKELVLSCYGPACESVATGDQGTLGRWLSAWKVGLLQGRYADVGSFGG